MSHLRLLSTLAIRGAFIFGSVGLMGCSNPPDLSETITQFKTLSPQLERLEGGASKVPNLWCNPKSAAAFQRQYADDLKTAKLGGYCGALPWFVQDFWIATDSGTIFGGHLLGYAYLSEEAVGFTETEVSLEPSVGNSGGIKFRLVPIAPRWAEVDAEH